MFAPVLGLFGLSRVPVLAQTMIKPKVVKPPEMNSTVVQQQGTPPLIGISPDKAHPGVSGSNYHSGNGVVGSTDSGHGVRGESFNGTGVYGVSNSGLGYGVYGEGTTHVGVHGVGEKYGVSALSENGTGVHGVSHGKDTVENKSSRDEVTTLFRRRKSAGVYGESNTVGVFGISDIIGVSGVANNGGIGVHGYSDTGTAVVGISDKGTAGAFYGKVTITGMLTKGGGAFKIDHPLAPEKRYLSHSFVESPDMMNIYNGNVTTDANGDASVTLPKYFAALNRDFRYQLTVVGQFAQAIVADKVKDNRFTIKTDKPNVEVSWQVTGIRQDAWANAHRIKVEEDKTGKERGSYLHPELFGQPKEKSTADLILGTDNATAKNGK